MLGGTTHRTDTDERLPWGVVLAYAAPGIALGYVGFLRAVYFLKYSTDVLLVSAAAMAVLMPLVKVLDGAADVLVGYLSDHTRSRFGRRKPWVVVGLPAMALAFVALWVPPDGLGPAGTLLWLGAALALFHTAGTVTLLPWGALGTQLALAHHDRSRLFASGHVVHSAGTILAIAAMQLLIAAPSQREVALPVAVAGAAVMVVLMAWALRIVPERPAPRRERPLRPLAAVAALWRNPHGRRLLLLLVSAGPGAHVFLLALPYTAEYVVQAREHTGPILFTALIAGALTPPLWVRVSRRIGKRRTYLISLLGRSAAYLSLVGIGPGALAHVYVVAALLGTMKGAAATVFPSMTADVVDDDELRTGERREGLYLSAMGVIGAANTGIGAAIVGAGLAATGYVAGAAQAPPAYTALLAMSSVVPAISFAGAGAVFWGYSLDHEEHGRIRAALATRGAAMAE